MLASPAAVTRGSTRLYYACVLLIAAGAMGAFVSTDLFFFYAFHELALIPTFLMIGMYGSGDRRSAAWKITIYLGLGSLVLLAGLAALFLKLGGTTFDMAKLTAAAHTTAGARRHPGVDLPHAGRRVSGCSSRSSRFIPGLRAPTPARPRRWPCCMPGC